MSENNVIKKTSKECWILRVSDLEHKKYDHFIGYTSSSSGFGMTGGRSSGPTYTKEPDNATSYESKREALEAAPNIGFMNLKADQLEPVKIEITTKVKEKQ